MLYGQEANQNSEMIKYIGNYSVKQLKSKLSLIEIMKYYDSLQKNTIPFQ